MSVPAGRGQAMLEVARLRPLARTPEQAARALVVQRRALLMAAGGWRVPRSVFPAGKPKAKA